MKKRILLVEDEESIREILMLNLEMEDYNVVACEDGISAYKTFLEEKFDLILLDIMLPGKDGLSLCESIRLNDSETPILFLSAKGNAEDRVAGLKKGGDDYLTKPFNLEELLLRVKILINRNNKNESPQHGLSDYKFGVGNYINFESYEAKGVSGKIVLTKKEVMLLKLFAENEGEVVSRSHILNTVWGYNVFPSTRTIDNFILAFRKYFEKDPRKPRHFISLRGVGYKFLK